MILIVSCLKLSFAHASSIHILFVLVQAHCKEAKGIRSFERPVDQAGNAGNRQSNV
jgi:hypothetical protein